MVIPAGTGTGTKTSNTGRYPGSAGIPADPWILLTKANQKFGILKRTCHFVTCKNSRRVLYLALVRSKFEHCSPVWQPVAT